MTDRIPEHPEKGWKKFLRRAKHVDGSTTDLVNPFEAGQRQTAAQADLNNPKNKTRETPLGTRDDQPIRGGRPEPLKNTDNSKNSPLI